VIAVTAMALLASIEGSDVVARLTGLAGGSGSTGSQISFAPYLLIIGLFTFVYVYMPNTRVRLGPALVGATFAGLLWAAVGALFARIVVYSTKTLVIYAGFAVVLLSLVWLHLSWLILLLGAQLSFYVQHPEYLRTGHSEIPMTGALRERLAMSVMYLLGRSFLEGGPRWSINALAERLEVPGTVIDEIVSALEAHGLVLTAEDDTVAPARALASIGLDQIMDAIRNETHDPRRPVPQPVPTADAASSAAESAMMDSMRGRSLHDLVGA
jgi:membrane protein